MTGSTALRLIFAELMDVAGVLSITPKSVTVGLFSDQEPSDAHVWFYDYADAQRFADHYGIGDRVTFNGDSDSTLLHLGRPTYETGAPAIAGMRVGLRLVCDRPGTGAAPVPAGPIVRAASVTRLPADDDDDDVDPNRTLWVVPRRVPPVPGS